MARLRDVVEREWGERLIRSWNESGWIDLPARVAGRLAPLVGAAADEVAVADSTSVNLFKLLAGALRLRPGRRVILSEAENFPTDLYVAQGLAWLVPGLELRLVPRAALGAALDERVAVLMLTQVDFRTGEIHDMAEWTAAAHRKGALSLFDLSHSAGALPVELTSAEVDLAVGCGYKYLNGGPGAPAFAFVARRHQAGFETPLSGWMGHAEPFAFDARYRPAAGIARLACGTPPILSLAALECGVATIERGGVARLRRKSRRSPTSSSASSSRSAPASASRSPRPRETERRGSQVSLRHPEGYAIVQALVARGVDRRLPRARPAALRLRAGLPALQRRLGRGRGAARRDAGARVGAAAAPRAREGHVRHGLP